MDTTAARQRALALWAARRTDLIESAHPPLTQQALLACQERLGFLFPSELVEWLHHCNGAALAVDPPIFHGVPATPARYRGIEGHIDYGVANTWRESRWLPIADDQCGDYYLLIPSKVLNRSIVVFWDQACDGENAFDSVAASSLWHFLAGVLDPDHAGHDAGDGPGWPFDPERTLEFDPDLHALTDLPMPWDDSDQ